MSARDGKIKGSGDSPQTVFSSPHLFCRRSSAQIMWLVSACLFPAALWAVWLFGWPALRVITLSIFSCAATEALANWLLSGGNRLYQNKLPKIAWTLDDGSAVLSGLLLGMNLSPQAAWYQPVFAGIFAMAVCKWSFGGLGGNWVNPALGGRAFVFFSFGEALTQWPPPRYIWQNGVQNFDAHSVATPLGSFKERLLLGHDGGNAPATELQNWGAAMGFQEDKSALWNLALGFQGGSSGEVASILLLLGGLVLLGLRIIRWHIPIVFLASFSLLTWIFGGLYQDRGYFGGAVLFHLLSGGLMLGAWFMATDYSSSPKMPLSQVIFGSGCGVLTFLIRFYGSYPEGVMLAILFMNIWTPTLDILIPPRVFGAGRRGLKSRNKDRRTVLDLPGY